jgi:tetratricopeptide (TPR) repeat protein
MRTAVYILLCLAAATPVAQAQTVPPRSINDITAVLDRQKPDPSRTGKMRADADAEPRPGANGQALADFLFHRAQARAGLGRVNDAVADVSRSLEIKRAGGGDLYPAEILLLRQYARAGEARKGLDLVARMITEYDRPGHKRRLFGVYGWAITVSLGLGNIQQAEAHLKKMLALAEESRRWSNYEEHRGNWTGIVEYNKARLFESRGQFSEAEAAYHRSQELRRNVPTQNPEFADDIRVALDNALVAEGRMKAKQGRLAEAEADVRRALSNRLNAGGKFHPDTAGFLTTLAMLLFEQARYGEAEEIARTAVGIYGALGYPDHSQPLINAMLQQANALNNLQRGAEAAAIFDRIDQATKNLGPERRMMATGGLARVSTLIGTKNPATAVEIAKEAFERLKTRFGEKHPDTATARGYHGVALARVGGRDMEALNELKAAVPSLISASRESDDDAVYLVQRDQRNRFVIETYMGLSARVSRDRPEDVALETFQLADVIRGHSVQRALTASSARMATRDPKLAALIRQDQDLQRQVGAQAGLLRDILALPPEQREDKAVRDAQAAIDKLRGERAAARRLAIGAGTGVRPVSPAGGRPRADARRSAASSDDRPHGWPGLQRRCRQDAVQLRPSAVLGALHHHRRRRLTERGTAGVWEYGGVAGGRAGAAFE